MSLLIDRRVMHCKCNEEISERAGTDGLNDEKDTEVGTTETLDLIELEGRGHIGEKNVGNWVCERLAFTVNLR